MSYLTYLYYNLEVHLVFINWKSQHVSECIKTARVNGGNAPSPIKINTENKTEKFWGINNRISRNWWSESVLKTG